jgi:hypothetical protein
MTVQANYEEHLCHIPHEKLPKMFQDAVTITRALGFSYLWIDSLCIIQDKRSDWEVEFSLMDKVFQNSALTIAAADAENANIGMLERTPPKLQCCSVSPPERSRGGLLIGPNLGSMRNNIYRSSNRAALSFRAWALQERLLSPRVLFFGAKELYYECRSRNWFES